MKEITELKDKYLVLKKEDLDRFFSQFTKGIFTTKEEQWRIDKIPFNAVLKEIQAYRQSIGKKDNRYVVLNLDDEIDLSSLVTVLYRIENTPQRVIGDSSDKIVKVKNIAVTLVNAILKAKEKP